MAKFPGWYYLDFFMCYDSRRQCLSQQGLTPLTSAGVPKPWQLAEIIGRSMRPHWPTAWEEVTHAQHWLFCFIAHVSERSLVPHKRKLCLKCFYMGIFIFYETSKIIGFHMTFSKVVSVCSISSTSSSLVSSHPPLHQILITFLVFIKFFADKEKSYFSFSFFTFILCLARLLKVLSELKVF